MSQKIKHTDNEDRKNKCKNDNKQRYCFVCGREVEISTSNYSGFGIPLSFCCGDHTNDQYWRTDISAEQQLRNMAEMWNALDSYNVFCSFCGVKLYNEKEIEQHIESLKEQ